LHGNNVHDIINVHTLSGDAHTNTSGKRKVILGSASYVLLCVAGW